MTEREEKKLLELIKSIEELREELYSFNVDSVVVVERTVKLD